MKSNYDILVELQSRLNAAEAHYQGVRNSRAWGYTWYPPMAEEQALAALNDAQDALSHFVDLVDKYGEALAGEDWTQLVDATQFEAQHMKLVYLRNSLEGEIEFNWDERDTLTCKYRKMHLERMLRTGMPI